MTATEQLALDLSPIIEPTYAEGLSLAERFSIFHDANPHVADALESLARQWLASHSRVGVKALVERIRWESGIQTHGEAWRINNSHAAFYARLLIERNPSWAGAIQTREQRAA